MRDGTILRATVLRPSAAGRFPTLILRTPYGAARALTFTTLCDAAIARGYAVVAQDVRGRFASDGEFDPYRQEGRDGYDTIEWAAAAPWSDGRIGTFGLSYPAAAQWLAALEGPPHLLAMAPAMTFARPDQFWFAGGVRDLSWVSWIWLYIAPEERRRRGLPGPRTYEEAVASWREIGPSLLERRPIADVPEIAEVAPWYLEWLAHPPDDRWWRWADLAGRYGRISPAVLHLSGWHDESYGPRGALSNHAGIVDARAGSEPRSRLVVGPWTHGLPPRSADDDTVRTGDRVVGPSARFDFGAEVLRFMDRHVRGVAETPAEAPVRVFVMGENRWLAADRWPLPGTLSERLFLGGTGRDGTLTCRPGPEGWLELLSDPARPVRDPYASAGGGAHDYRDLAHRPGTLAFESGPLTAARRVVGAAGAEIFLSTDAPDLDLWVKLLHVEADGTAWNLMGPGADVLRLGAREGGRDLHQIERVRLEGLLTGNRFAAGDRIRIVVMASFAPHFATNPQTGEPETGTSATRPARVRIHFGRVRPSCLELPVVP